MIGSSNQNDSIKLYFYRGLAVAVFLFAIYLLTVKTESGWFGILMFIFYILLLSMEYKIGIFLLPALLPILDLGIWNGNILYGEYDVLFLLTAAFLLWEKKTVKLIRYSYEVLFIALLLWFFVCSFVGFYDYFREYEVYDIYQSSWNSIRVGKGFVAAWISWFLIRGELYDDYKKTIKWLASGVCCGLFLLSLGILWERHVFSSIFYANNIYGFFSTLLDFSSTYRVTGLFSGMHVGGTALDGYLVCVLPLVFFVVTRQSKPVYWGVVITVFALGLYCLIVTFTRMTIASFAFSFAVSGILLLLNNKNRIVQKGVGIQSLIFGFSFVAVIVILAVVQKQAGYQALMSGILGFIISVVVIHKSRSNGMVVWLFLGSVFSLCTYGIIDSIRDSQWHEDVVFFDAMLIAISVSAGLLLLGILCASLLKISGLNLRSLGIPIVVGSAFLMMIVGMGSTRMTERMHGVSSDLQIRSKHWQDVIDSAQPNIGWSAVWGHGMGSMPKLYYQSHFEKMALPSYRWNLEDGKTLLEIGKSGYPFYQKLMLKPDTLYQMFVVIKFADDKGALGIDICHKHILFSDRWQPGCVEKGYRSVGKGWQIVNWSFNSGNLGRKGWLDWPPTLQIHNYGNSVISIDSVQIMDAAGQQILNNPDFDQKLSHWFWVSDFEHLPWHSKQIFIHLWLEQGWVGLLLFLLLLGFGLRHQLGLLKSGESIPVALLPSVLAIFGLGLTDTFIDEPQTTLMTFTVLFAALQWPQPLILSKQSR